MKFERCDRCGVEGKVTMVGNFDGYFSVYSTGGPPPNAWKLDLCAMCEAAVKAVAMRKPTILSAPTPTRKWWRARRAP